MKAVEDLLLDLVAIPSVSALDNSPVTDYVARSLDPEVWRIEQRTWTSPAGVQKTNLIAITRNAEGNNAELTFVCHSDTVPYDAAWNEAVKPLLRDGCIYGRGSADVKGYLACVLRAADGIDTATLSKPIAIVITADEEVGCVGAKRLASEHAFTTHHMLIGEPTSLRPIRAGKGYALATITVHGREAHSAFPTAGHNAIYDAARIITGIEGIAKEMEGHGSPDFDPPYTSINVGLIEGGTAKNIVPGQCRITVEWRPIPGQSPEVVADKLAGLLADLRATVPDFEADLHTLRMDPPFDPSPSQDLTTLLTGLTGNVPGTISFGSEAAHLARLAGSIVVMGPGDMGVAHQTGEYVPVAELHACVEHLKAAIQHYCA